MTVSRPESAGLQRPDRCGQTHRVERAISPSAVVQSAAGIRVLSGYPGLPNALGQGGAKPRVA